MDGATLATAMGNSLSLAAYNGYVDTFNAALIAAHCTTVNRVAMFCAQVGEESGGLRWMEELASGAEYEGRRDLGNVHPGDGKRYKGRGPIQLTGAANYGAFSRWAHTQGLVPTDTYFVQNPTLVAQPQWGFLAAAWYWTVARAALNSYADAGNVLAATKAINGGTNGLADRTARWKRALTLGSALLPTGGDDMAAVPQSEWNDVHAQEMRSEPPWAGGYTDDKSSSYDLFMYTKRTNVELHQCWLAVQALTAKVDALTASVTGLAARKV